MALPECGNKSCAACQYSPLTERNECVALEKCLLTENYCPFYRAREEAEQARAESRQRAERFGLIASDGTYRQQRFVRARRELDKHGIPCVVTRPEIGAWLEDLVAKGSVPVTVLERYTAANPE